MRDNEESLRTREKQKKEKKNQIRLSKIRIAYTNSDPTPRGVQQTAAEPSHRQRPASPKA